MKPKCIRNPYIKAILWFGLLVLAGYVALSLYALGKGSKKLQRGKFIDELLLTSYPIRSFPENLIVGSRTYSFYDGEPTGRSTNLIRIESPEIDPGALKKCSDWLIKCGFKPVAGDLAKTNMIFQGAGGLRAEVRVTKSSVTVMAER